MGMYNEVWKSCPYCAKKAYLQISQIVLGFGEFDLDDLDGLTERLNEEELKELYENVKNEHFSCREDGGGCGRAFLLEDTKKARLSLAEDLFT